MTFAALDGDGFRQRTFERGVEGETLACGTGAVAVVAAAKRLDRVCVSDEDWITVTPPGGELGVAVPDDGPARLRGPAEKRFEGELSAPDGDRIAGVTGEAALGVDRFDADNGGEQ